MSDPVRLRWLGQAGFVLHTPEARVVIDPFASPAPGRVVPPLITADELGAVDLVLVTHEHIDHLDLPLLAAAMTPGSTAVLGLPEPLLPLARDAGLAADRLLGLAPGNPVPVGVTTVTSLPALHGVHVSDAYTFGTEHHGGRHPYLGYVVDIAGLRVFHAGDSLDYPGLSDRLRELGVHVALLPINGRDAEREAQDLVGNMDATEAADLAARAGVSVVVPMHYDMFATNLGDPAAFVAIVRERHPELTVFIPAHGRDMSVPSPL